MFMKMQKALRKNKKGFTLIELIVVIAILAILALIAVPRLSGFSEKARIKADIATFNEIDKAIAVAVAEGTLKATTAATKVVLDVSGGTVTWDETSSDAEGTGDLSTIMGALIQDTIKFQVSGNQSLTDVTWDIATDGTITPPVISSTTGVITP